MNILQLHNKIPFPPKDGGSVAVYNLSEAFVKLNHNVDILALNTKKHFVDFNTIEKLLPEHLNIISVDIDTSIKPIKALTNFLFSELPYNAERFISEKFKAKLTELLKQKEFDIIQIEGLYMMPYINVIKANTKSFISYRAHNVEHEIWGNTILKEKNLLKRIYLRNLHKKIKKFELTFIDQYDLLVPISEKDADFFIKMRNTKKIHICPAGLDSSKYNRQNFKIDKTSFFHLGSLDWIPNREGLLWFLENVWTKINKKYDSLSFSIAGRNAPETFTKQLSRYYNILYRGEIDNACEFMQQHSIMIVPLFSGSGMRIKIIEGMASGNIVITTPKGAEGIDAVNGKHFLIAENEIDFIKHIDHIFEGKYNLQEISKNARQFISDNFDTFAVSKSLLTFYEKAINEQK